APTSTTLERNRKPHYLEGGRILKTGIPSTFFKVGRVPTSHAAAHGITFLVVHLFQEADGEPLQPRQIVNQDSVSNSVFILTERHIQTPVKRILNSPVAANA